MAAKTHRNDKAVAHGYRINFGQGQEKMPGTLAQLQKFLADWPTYQRFAFIEFRDPMTGAWINAKFLPARIAEAARM